MYQKHKCVKVITKNSFFITFVQDTHTCIHRKSFMDHATRIIFLYNMDAPCNMKSALCDMSNALYEISTAVCDAGALCDVSALCDIDALQDIRSTPCDMGAL